MAAKSNILRREMRFPTKQSWHVQLHTFICAIDHYQMFDVRRNAKQTFSAFALIYRLGIFMKTYILYIHINFAFYMYLYLNKIHQHITTVRNN